MHCDRLKRREFITLIAGTATWPVAAGAQQPAMSIIGYLGAFAPTELQITAIRKGLAELGYVEGRNVVVDVHSDGQYDRLSDIATDFVRRQVALIVAISTPPALAAKAATSTIPIVFNVADGPVKLGLVASLARPGGNATGMTFLLGGSWSQATRACARACPKHRTRGAADQLSQSERRRSDEGHEGGCILYLSRACHRRSE
jgi:putative tryptophan/tyrosine transport system substrate-binding protein